MNTMQLEPAIPEHLIRERTQPKKIPSQDYQPPFPAYSSRFSESIKEIVIAIIGAQHKEKPTSSNALETLISFMKTDVRCRPAYWLPASSTDSIGAYNEVVIGYWKDKSEYENWLSDSGFREWWGSLTSGSNGWFKEVFLPPADRFETVFSDTAVPEGVANMQTHFSGMIQEHVYWGSMRDRMPASQTDRLTGSKEPGQSQNGKRIRVSGRKNLAIIRSGQDWSNTTPHERKLYLETMHPVLIRGMDFLRDQGGEVGCFSNRFMEVLDPETLAPTTEKTFGLGYFDDLASLEGWSKKHKTHLDIFGRFLQYAKELENNVSLRLFHEVLVVEPDQQQFEYIGCHDRTGMLVSLSGEQL